MIANKIRTIDMVSDSNSMDDFTVVKKVKYSEDSDTTSDNVDEDGNKLSKMARAFKTIIEVTVLFSSPSSVACLASSSVTFLLYIPSLVAFLFFASCLVVSRRRC